MSHFGQKAKSQLVERILGKKAATSGPVERNMDSVVVSEAFTRLEMHLDYERILVLREVADRFGIDDPFFKTHEGVAGATTYIEGREFINFANYNYLGLAGHPAVNRAATEAIAQYGTSASASRMAGGERPVQRALEEALAELYGVEDCVAFVSGHATNVTTIGHLFGPKDLVVHDSLIHNSVLEGIKLSGAARRAFPHNDHPALDALLAEIRPRFERVLIVVEGLYSMDGDIACLPELIAIKRRHKVFLMVDDAHSLGVLGETGRGIREHFGLAGTDVDIWMGTLSKTLAGCGGYIAGARALIDHLKYSAPGFVYSVGLAPPLAAASLEALRIMLREPQRVERLRARSWQLMDMLQSLGFDTGLAQGHAIVPVITGSSFKAGKLAQQLFQSGINVVPIIYPAVDEKAARIRFFVSSSHSKENIEFAYVVAKKLVGHLVKRVNL